MKEILHQQQPTSDSCASTCIAMLLGKHVQEVINEFHVDYAENRINPGEYLLMQGVMAIPLLSTKVIPNWGKLYLAAVPSLNLIATIHYIVIDLRDNVFKIYDPNMWKTDKKYYVVRDEGDLSELEVEIGGYILDLEIIFND